MTAEIFAAVLCALLGQGESYLPLPSHLRQTLSPPSSPLSRRSFSSLRRSPSSPPSVSVLRMGAINVGLKEYQIMKRMRIFTKEQVDAFHDISRKDWPVSTYVPEQ